MIAEQSHFACNLLVFYCKCCLQNILLTVNIPGLKLDKTTHFACATTTDFQYCCWWKKR